MHKFHWGHGIIVFFVCFISFMGYLAFRSSQENIDLVTDDYYRQELVYQSQMEKMRNAQALAEPVRVQVDGKGVQLNFPKLAEAITGQIQIFRPSDSQHDRLAELRLTTSGQQQLDLSTLPAGMYRLKIEWQAGPTAYYTEEAIHLK
jgi:hypothetical protein